MSVRALVILRISEVAFDDIAARIKALGPDYERDMFRPNREHGTMIVLDGSEVALVVDYEHKDPLTI